jgi:hypothetical protein
MSSGIDYIPKADSEFQVWTHFFVKNLDTMRDRLHIPPEVYATLTAQNDDFTEKLVLATQPGTRTTPAVAAKNEARSILKKTVRQMVKEFLVYNHALTNPDREALGLPVHKTTRTPAPVAATPPHFEIGIKILRHLTVHFYDSEQMSKAKPAGQLGVEIRWMISTAPPAHISDFVHSSLDLHSPFTLEFEEDERGKTVYFCLCWINTRAKQGPWSEIKSAIIP